MGASGCLHHIRSPLWAPKNGIQATFWGVEAFRRVLRTLIIPTHSHGAPQECLDCCQTLGVAGYWCLPLVQAFTPPSWVLRRWWSRFCSCDTCYTCAQHGDKCKAMYPPSTSTWACRWPHTTFSRPLLAFLTFWAPHVHVTSTWAKLGHLGMCCAGVLCANCVPGT